MDVQNIVDVDAFGPARIRITTGDMDGSGEAPGVNLAIDHDYGQPMAVAMSKSEAERFLMAFTDALEKLS